LQTILRATRGQFTLDDLARLAGRSRSTIQIWLERFIQSGIAGLLKRSMPTGAPSPIKATAVQAEFLAGLQAGRWRTVSQVAGWLKEAHRIERAPKSIHYWLAKLGWRARRSGIFPK
jgi:transposase